MYVKLTQKVGQAEVSVNVQLQAHFAGSKDEDIEFNPQEVYEKITLQGYLHLDDLIRGDFLKAAEEDKAIQKAFTRYVKHERPVLFIEELSKAIRGLEFSGKLLSNMERIDAQVDFNTVTATLKASFNGN